MLLPKADIHCECFMERFTTPEAWIALATLVAEGIGQHMPKGYLYFAMGFSIFVEVLNLRAGKSGTAPGGVVVSLKGSASG